VWIDKRQMQLVKLKQQNVKVYSTVPESQSEFDSESNFELESESESSCMHPNHMQTLTLFAIHFIYLELELGKRQMHSTPTGNEFESFMKRGTNNTHMQRETHTCSCIYLPLR